MATRQGRIPPRPETVLAEIECPVERWVAACNEARAKGTLSAPVAEIRRTALLQAVAAGNTVLELAKAANRSTGRLYRLMAEPT